MLSRSTSFTEQQLPKKFEIGSFPGEGQEEWEGKERDPKS